MKATILVYCGEDSEAAKALAASLRNDTCNVIMGAAAAFDGYPRRVDRIVIANDVPQRLRVAIAAAHGLPDETPDGLQIAHCKMFQVKEVLERLASARTVIAKKKRGWPKGKSRKAVTITFSGAGGGGGTSAYGGGVLVTEGIGGGAGGYTNGGKPHKAA